MTTASQAIRHQPVVSTARPAPAGKGKGQGFGRPAQSGSKLSCLSLLSLECMQQDHEAPGRKAGTATLPCMYLLTCCTRHPTHWHAALLRTWINSLRLIWCCLMLRSPTGHGEQGMHTHALEHAQGCQGGGCLVQRRLDRAAVQEGLLISTKLYGCLFAYACLSWA